MNDDRSLERAARSWLEAGPTQAPDRAVEAALLQIETTSQERDLRIPWRLPKMTTPARVASAAVIGVLALGGAFYVYNRTQPAVGGPASSPGPTAGQTQVDGTWQSCPTEQEIRAAGGDPAEASGNAGCTTLTLRDSVFRETGASASTSVPGNYVVDGTSITINRSNGEAFAFTWSVVGDKLTLTKSPTAGAISPAPWLAKPFQRAAGQTQVDGTWQSCPTEQEIRAAGGDPAEASGNAGCTTLTLRDSVFRETGASASTSVPGNYVVDGTSITINRSNGEAFAFTWSVVGDKLTLTKSPTAGAISPAPWLAKPFQRAAG